MPQQQTLTRTLVFEECFTCGMPIALSEGHLRRFNEEGESIYCVSGHITVRRKSDNRQLREDLAAAQEWVTRLETAVQDERKETQTWKNAHENQGRMLEREQTKRKRLENRVHDGVCPHCRRSFQNVQRHMARQHPEVGVAT